MIIKVKNFGYVHWTFEAAFACSFLKKVATDVAHVFELDAAWTENKVKIKLFQ
jgi:hypothetical protein